MLKSATNALVLSRFQAAALPWLYMASALIAGFLAVVVRSGKRRLTPGRLAIFGAFVALAATVAIPRLSPSLALGFYLLVELVSTQVVLLFWGAVGDAFDARESKRAFTWINGLGMGGAVLGGIVATLLVKRSGTESLALGGAMCLLGAALVWPLHRSDAEPEPRKKFPRQWAKVLDSSYARFLGLSVFGYALVQSLVDFVFRQRAASHLSETAMASLFALHQVGTGILCVAFQLLIAERLLRRLGLQAFLLGVPVLLGGAAIGAAIVPSIWTTFGLKVLESAVSWSFMPVAMQLLYAPLADSLRDSIRRISDGLLKKVGNAFGGLLLVVVASRALMQCWSSSRSQHYAWSKVR